MTQHQFLFHPGSWIGEGRVSFNASAEIIRFYTKWLIEAAVNGEISSLQEVEMQGTEPNMFNRFKVSQVTPISFVIALENELLGQVTGSGVVDEKTIAWEFHGKGSLEGFEVYELQDNGDYLLHAEYSSLDQFRTIIDGRVWKKSD